jgi:hypothetical protein
MSDSPWPQSRNAFVKASHQRFYALAFDAFQSMASNAPCTGLTHGLTPSDGPDPSDGRFVTTIRIGDKDSGVQCARAFAIGREAVERGTSVVSHK